MESAESKTLTFSSTSTTAGDRGRHVLLEKVLASSVPGNVRTRIEMKRKEADKYTSLCSCEMREDKDSNAERN